MQQDWAMHRQRLTQDYITRIEELPRAYAPAFQPPFQVDEW